MAASDEEVLRHGEMEEANFVGDPVEAESKIGKDAKQASLTRIELWVVVGGDEQLARSGGKIGSQTQEVACPCVGQIEVKP